MGWSYVELMSLDEEVFDALTDWIMAQEEGDEDGAAQDADVLMGDPGLGR